MRPAPVDEARRARPGAILFMCGLNAIRSPMAEVIAKRLLSHDIYVQSAGVRAGEPDHFIDVVLQEIGLCLPKHRPRTFDELEDDYFDVIVTLSPQAHHFALELTRSHPVEVIYWPMQDPAAIVGDSREQILDAYRQARDEIWRQIEDHFVRPWLREAQNL